MPLRLEIKKQFTARSERVKSTDFHPREPWILAALYSGHVFIWNHQTQSLVKSLEVCDLPVRCAKFIAKKNWIVTGSDDMRIRVYNYNTLEKVKEFEAHTDYIRCLAVHPTLPLLLSSSDDMFIKLWDWDKNFECLQVFDGHTHYVMQVEFNPKDPDTFASGSLDRTVKVWGLKASTPYFTLKGHERGVNCIGYFRGGDRPYLVSGGDDHLVKIWDYQTKSCVATLEGHTNNVSSVSFHPSLPLIITGAEDGTVRLWHSNTYRLENTLNYGMERVWTISCLKGTNRVALGYDDGTVMIKLGHEEPVMSMERGGKVVYAVNNDIVIANLKKVDFKESVSQAAALPGSAAAAAATAAAGGSQGDGDRLIVPTKEMGACEVYPQSLQHSPNARLLCVCGDGEYIIYNALQLKNKSFGQGLEFVWAADSGYAIRESTSKVKIFNKNFKEHKQFKPSFVAEGIFGGTLLGIRSADFIDFYDWVECRIVRRIDACPRKVYWSESGDVVVLACDTSFYVLKYNRELVTKFFDQNVDVGDQGIEGAFEIERDVGEKVRTGYFVGDCFIYTNSAGRLNYYVGGEVITLAHLAKPMYLLGYMPKENRVYLMDKQHNLFSYSLLVSVLIYQTAIVRKDYDGAEKALAQIPKSEWSRLARFLEAQDLKPLALKVSTDPEHKFELAMSLKKLALAREILLDAESEQKWKQLGDAALHDAFDLKLAEECYYRAGDFGALLLIYTSTGNKKGMAALAKLAAEAGRHNIAFVCLFTLGHVDACVQLLCETGRVPEAAFLTRTYQPSAISRVLKLWKDDLRQVSAKAADSLADPADYEELFPNLAQGRRIERWLALQRAQTGLPPAKRYPDLKDTLSRDLLSDAKDLKLAVPDNFAVPATPNPFDARDARAELDAKFGIRPAQTPRPAAPAASPTAAAATAAAGSAGLDTLGVAKPSPAAAPRSIPSPAPSPSPSSAADSAAAAAVAAAAAAASAAAKPVAAAPVAAVATPVKPLTPVASIAPAAAAVASPPPAKPAPAPVAAAPAPAKPAAAAAPAPAPAPVAAAPADDEGEDVDKLLGELQADETAAVAGAGGGDDKKVPDWEGGDF